MMDMRKLSPEMRKMFKQMREKQEAMNTEQAIQREEMKGNFDIVGEPTIEHLDDGRLKVTAMTPSGALKVHYIDSQVFIGQGGKGPKKAPKRKMSAVDIKFEARRLARMQKAPTSFSSPSVSQPAEEEQKAR